MPKVKKKRAGFTPEDLKIKPIETSKDQIRHPPLSSINVIPKLGNSCILIGTTGMGKSTLLTNLIVKPQFFGKDVFDFKFLISPTAEGDDVQKALGIKEKDTFTNLNEAPFILQSIIKCQKKMIKDKGNAEAPQILVVFDDCISDPIFVKTNEFVKCFIASRHINATTMICSQSWSAVPRRCRLQARNIFFFDSPLSEVELLCLEYCPARMTKPQFYKMVEYATSEPYSFLYINKNVPVEQRFRKNLSEVINLNHFRKLIITRSDPTGEKTSARNNGFKKDESAGQSQKPGRGEESSNGFRKKDDATNSEQEEYVPGG